MYYAVLITGGTYWSLVTPLRQDHENSFIFLSNTVLLIVKGEIKSGQLTDEYLSH